MIRLCFERHYRCLPAVIITIIMIIIIIRFFWKHQHIHLIPQSEIFSTWKNIFSEHSGIAVLHKWQN